MSFLHAHSCECLKSELDLFTLPPTQTSIEASLGIHYKPISSLTDEAPIEFVVPGHGDEYIDLAHTMLSLRVQLKPRTGVMDANDKVAPVNNLLHSLFNQLDVSFNQKLVSPSNNAYAYRAYIETLLTYKSSTKASQLTAGMWLDDTPKQFDSLPISTADSATQKNKGLAVRQSMMASGKMVDLIGYLHSDIFNQEKFLLNGVELRLRLVRSRDAFCLMDASGKDYTVHITAASLIVRRVKISPGVLLAHAKALSRGTAKYPFTRVEVKSFTIHAGVHSETLDNVVLGQLPKRLVLGFVDNRAFNGDITKNPFNFQHFGLNFLSLYVDGIQVPSKPLQPDYNENLYADSYHTLVSGTGILWDDDSCGIKRSEYPHGHCLYCFDLTPDLSASRAGHWNLARHGGVRIEVRFANALTSTVNCIVYAEFDNVVEIDASRQVMVDFSG